MKIACLPRLLRLLPAFCLSLYLPAGGATDTNGQALEDAAARLRRTTLDNGIVCLLQEDHSAPVVAIQIWVGTGAIHEEEYLGGGLSHYVEHMIFKGTPTRAPGEISKQIHAAGGEINAYTSLDRTVFLTQLPSPHWETGLQVLLDAVMHASFPEAEYQREKDVILREMAMCKDDPERVANEWLWRTAYTVHPYRNPVIGYPEIFRTLNRDDLLKFFHRNYVPDNMIISVAGDIDPAQVEQSIRAQTTNFTRQARAPVLLPVEPDQVSPRFARVAGSYQVTRIHLAYHTVALSHPDAPALDLLAIIAGQGRSSRLTRAIKEKQKLVHSIDAWSFTPKDPGMFGISATLAPEQETNALQAIEKEVSGWATRPATRVELEKARRILLVAELSELQTMGGLASKFASGEFYARDPSFFLTYLRRIQGLKASDLQAVAARYLRPENRTITILCPTSTVTAAVAPATTPIPPVRRLATNSGVPFLCREDHRLPFVYFCAAFQGGLLSESPTNNGITRLMAEMLTRGTARRTAEEVAAQVESLGASLIPFSGQNSFGLQGRCCQADLAPFMDLFFDCLNHPAFPAEEVAKQKTVQIAAVAQQTEQPFFLARQALLAMLFPNHPYRWDPLGSRETLTRLTPDDLRSHHRKLVVSSNMTLAIFGDLDPDAIQAMTLPYLRALRQDLAPAREYPPAAPILPAYAQRREPRQQAIVLFGFPGVDLRDPRRDALALLETAMSGLSSPLSVEIRDKRGLAYYAGASQRPGLDPGLFMVYAGTREAALPEVQQLMAAEVTRVITAGITADELERARRQIVAEKDMALQDNLGLAMVCALDELYGVGYEYEFTVRERLQAWTPEEVRDAAASLLTTNRQATSIMLPQASDGSAPK